MSAIDHRDQPVHMQQPGDAASRRADALRRAARSKRQAATTRAETAIRQLVKNQQEINFRSVARTGGVSLDFLYANDDLRHRIESLRAQQTARTTVPPAGAVEADGNIVHTLTARLREERTARLPFSPRSWC